MAVFVIVPNNSSTHLNELISNKFGETSYQLPKGVWLLAYQGTTRQISDELRISGGGESGAGVVFSISSYWGNTDPEVWEWLKLHWT